MARKNVSSTVVVTPPPPCSKTKYETSNTNPLGNMHTLSLHSIQERNRQTTHNHCKSLYDHHATAVVVVFSPSLERPSFSEKKKHQEEGPSTPEARRATFDGTQRGIRMPACAIFLFLTE